MKFLNDTPIDDDMTVLDLLCRSWGDETDRSISLWPHSPPHVEVAYMRDFGESPSHRILITADVARRLKESWYVCGEPRWGSREDRKLLLTESGAHYLWSNEAKMSAQYGFSSLRWIRSWRS